MIRLLSILSIVLGAGFLFVPVTYGYDECVAYNSSTNPTPTLPCTYSGNDYDSLAVEAGLNSLFYQKERMVLSDMGSYYTLFHDTDWVSGNSILWAWGDWQPSYTELTFSKSGALFFYGGFPVAPSNVVTDFVACNADRDYTTETLFSEQLIFSRADSSGWFSTTRSPGAIFQELSLNADCVVTDLVIPLSASTDILDVDVYIYAIPDWSLGDSFDTEGWWHDSYTTLFHSSIDVPQGATFVTVPVLPAVELSMNEEYYVVVQDHRPDEVDATAELSLLYVEDEYGSDASSYDATYAATGKSYDWLSDFGPIGSITPGYRELIASDLWLVSQQHCNATSSLQRLGSACTQTYSELLFDGSLGVTYLVISDAQYTLDVYVDEWDYSRNEWVRIDSAATTHSASAAEVHSFDFVRSTSSASSSFSVLACVHPSLTFNTLLTEENNVCVKQGIAYGYENWAQVTADTGIPDFTRDGRDYRDVETESSVQRFITDNFDLVKNWGVLAIAFKYYDMAVAATVASTTDPDTGFVIGLNMSRFNLPASDASFDISRYYQVALPLRKYPL